MDALRLGRIFWLADPGKRGGGKKRPMIVATGWRDIARTKTVVAVVCSTAFGEPPGADEIRLPHDPDGKSMTRLKELAVAVCNWVLSIPASDIRETAGVVPTAILKRICEAAGLAYVPER